MVHANNKNNNLLLLLLLLLALRYVTLTKLMKARRMSWVVQAAHMENRTGICKVSVGTPERKR